MSAEPRSPAGSPLTKRLVRRIVAEGPLTFATFMEMALYDPQDGFYAKPPVGPGGHFVTSPHVSRAFGTLVARQVEQFWEHLDRPPAFTVVEVGAGDGTLAGQILSSIDPALRADLRYLAVERTAAGREATEGLGIATAGDIGEIEGGFEGCVIANELLDNVPFHRVRRTVAGVAELYVGSADDRFVLVEGPVSDPDLETAAREAGVMELPPSEEIVVGLQGSNLVNRACRALDRGYVWLCDYGWTGAGVHGYTGHRFRDDVLSDPGSSDITAGVDFDLLAKRAAHAGLHVWGPVTQRDALLALGFRDWNEGERAGQAGALDAGRGVDAVRTFAERSRAAMLIEPAGLGGFLVLCLGVGVDRAPRSVRPPVPQTPGRG